MKFILIPVASLVLCQAIKFVVYFWRGGNMTKHSIIWEGFWVAKFPSSHSALIGSSLYLLWVSYGFDAVFGFAFVTSLLIVYGLLEDKKRQELFESYVVKSKDDELKKIAIDRKLNEFNGHTVFEIASGLLIGIMVAVLLS